MNLNYGLSLPIVMRCMMHAKMQIFISSVLIYFIYFRKFIFLQDFIYVFKEGLKN